MKHRKHYFPKCCGRKMDLEQEQTPTIRVYLTCKVCENKLKG